MKEFFADRIHSDEGAETVEIIIGIVVFVVFGIAVFGMITNVAGNKMQDISKCLGDSQNIITKKENANAKNNTCNDYHAGKDAGTNANYNGTSSGGPKTK